MHMADSLEQSRREDDTAILLTGLPFLADLAVAAEVRV